MKKERHTFRAVKQALTTIESDSELDLEFLKNHKYSNFEFADWYGENLGVTKWLRSLVIEQLLKVYAKWDAELVKLKVDYYLALWLHEPRILKSEVVCAIEDKVEYYQKEALLSSTESDEFNPSRYGKLAEQLAQLNWTKKVDIEPYYDWEMDWPKEKYHSEHEFYKDRRFLKKLKADPFHKVSKEHETIYFNKVGHIWVGQ